MLRLFRLGLLPLLASCSLLPPVVGRAPFTNAAGTGQIAAKFNLIAPIGIEIGAMRVFFARLDPDRQQDSITLQGADFFPSTYLSNGHVYLLDAEPGEYVAVAACHSQAVMHMNLTTREQIATVVMRLRQPWTYEAPGWHTLFNDSVIQASRVTVEPGSRVYMGEFDVRQKMELHRAGANQRYAAVFIAPSVYSYEPSIWEPTRNYLAELERRVDTEQSRAEFWKKEAEAAAAPENTSPR